MIECEYCGNPKSEFVDCQFCDGENGTMIEKLSKRKQLFSDDVNIEVMDHNELVGKINELIDAVNELRRMEQ